MRNSYERWDFFSAIMYRIEYVNTRNTWYMYIEYGINIKYVYNYVYIYILNIYIERERDHREREKNKIKSIFMQTMIAGMLQCYG